MKEQPFILFLCFVLVVNCSKKIEKVELQEGTPAYRLATELSVVLPEFNPMDNRILIKTKEFHVTTGETIQFIWFTLGRRSQGLTNLDPERLKIFLSQRAELIAEQKILIKAADQAGISVQSNEIDSVMQQEIQQMGGEEKIVELLDENKLSKEHMRINIQERLVLNRYIDHLQKIYKDSILVSGEEVADRYQEDITATVRHILLMTQEKSDSAKKAIYGKMEKILSQVRNGSDFSLLAKEYSEDPGSKEKGGLYEDISRGQMVKPFEEAAFSVPVGEVSDIVETVYGYHILKIIDRKRETRPMDTVYHELVEKIQLEKWDLILQEHIEDLKVAARFEKIEI